VAGIAAEHGIPFVVISAGTRNHFALDLGLDRDDPSACLGALSDSVELRVDLGMINGQTFVNNVSFGAYAEVVATHPAEKGDELVESVTRLYCYLFGETAAVIRPAAAHRVRAMDLSDQWVREGCRPDSPLLPLERAALVRAYAALLAAVHHEEH
jgi:diacylglycerol kinase family enzyme